MPNGMKLGGGGGIIIDLGYRICVVLLSSRAVTTCISK